MPTRTCVACRTARPKRELVRVVRTPAGTVVLDLGGRAPGRGAYLCRDAACWDTAVRKRALEHALGTQVPFDVRILMTEQNPSVGGQAGSAPTTELDTNEGGARGQE
ncbi:MAG: YlxR family protein [Chloroflexota bacterium]